MKLTAGRIADAVWAGIPFAAGAAYGSWRDESALHWLAVIAVLVVVAAALEEVHRRRRRESWRR